MFTLNILIFISIFPTNRAFINEVLPTYAAQHSHIKFNIFEGSDKVTHPRLVGHYIDGKQVVPLRNKSSGEIKAYCDRLRSRSGRKLSMKRWPEAVSRKKSFQGGWTPEANVQYPVMTEAIQSKKYWEE